MERMGDEKFGRPQSGGENEMRKMKNAMGGLRQEIWKEWEENGGQLQKHSERKLRKEKMKKR